MANKKKRKPNQQGQQSGPNVSPFTKQQQMDSVRRMAQVMRIASNPPEPIRAMLNRLEIPFETVENVPGDHSHDTIVILVKDIEAGDERNAENGSILKQIYKGTDIVKQMPTFEGLENPLPSILPQNTHNPENGIRIIKDNPQA